MAVPELPLDPDPEFIVMCGSVWRDLGHQPRLTRNAVANSVRQSSEIARAGPVHRPSSPRRLQCPSQGLSIEFTVTAIVVEPREENSRADKSKEPFLQAEVDIL
jgi:hypothetical protein